MNCRHSSCSHYLAIHLTLSRYLSCWYWLPRRDFEYWCVQLAVDSTVTFLAFRWSEAWALEGAIDQPQCCKQHSRDAPCLFSLARASERAFPRGSAPSTSAVRLCKSFSTPGLRTSYQPTAWIHFSCCSWTHDLRFTADTSADWSSFDYEHAATISSAPRSVPNYVWKTCSSPPPCPPAWLSPLYVWFLSIGSRDYCLSSRYTDGFFCETCWNAWDAPSPTSENACPCQNFHLQSLGRDLFLLPLFSIFTSLTCLPTRRALSAI